MKRACVIGWPIEHSRSPMIHGHWLKRYDIDGSYTKVAVEPGDVERFLRGLGEAGYAGCNVTIPHKEVAYRVAAERDASAVAVEAANTVWLEDGKLAAANTDTYGFMTNLSVEAPGWEARDQPVAILGAGGAARAIVYGFLQAGVSEVRVFNRTGGRAEDLARHFGARVKACDWSQRENRSADAGVLVNTTSLGLKGEGSVGMSLDGLDERCVVADIVYVPLETALLAEARQRGLRTVGGLGMLLHQAVPGFEKWFGVRPDVDSKLFAAVSADIPKS